MGCYVNISGTTIGCGISTTPGIHSFYIGNYSADTTTWLRNTNNDQISGSTSGPKLFLFEQVKGLATYTETPEVSPAGAITYRQRVNVTFVGLSQANREQYELLATGKWVVAVRARKSGEYYLLGETDGLQVVGDGSEITAGQGSGDDPVMRITLEALADAPADTITSAHVAQLVLAAS